MKEADGMPVVHATVSLLKIPDTTIIKNVVTCKDWLYTFEAIPKGRYIVRVSYIRFLSPQSATVEMTGHAMKVPQLSLGGSN